MAKRTKKTFITLADIEPREAEWLLKWRIIYGGITLLEGDPNASKSYLAMHLAARVSKGGVIIPGEDKVEQGPVLYCTNEDDPSYTVRPRIEAMGGDLNQIRVQGEYFALDDKGFAKLKAEVREFEPALMVFDTFTAYADGDIYKPNVVRKILGQLNEIAQDTESAVVVVRHLTKMKQEKAIYRGAGTMDIMGAARSALMVGAHPTMEGVKVLAHIKHNLSPKAKSWMYRLSKKNDNDPDEVPTVEWLGETDLEASDLQGSTGEESRKGQLDTAVEFLERELADGPKPTNEVEKKAEKEGIAKRTLDRAREEASVKSRRDGNAWVMALPSKDE